MSILVKLFMILLMLNSLSGYSQKIPTGGRVMLVNKTLKGSQGRSGSYHNVYEVEYNDKWFKEVSRIVTRKQAVKPWNMGVRINKIKSGVKKGDVLLFTCMARTISAEQETGEAVAGIILQQKRTHTKVLKHELNISKNWKRYFIPFVSEYDMTPSELMFAVNFGYLKQKFEISRLKLINYQNKYTIDELPKNILSYYGMEEDSKWREEAEKRIDKFRKGDIKIKVISSDNTPVTDAIVHIKQIGHKFRFGAAIDAKQFNTDPKYKEVFYKLFNHAVFHNDLKIKAWREPKIERTITVLDELNRNNIPVRGHVLIWPGFKYLTPEFKMNENNPSEIRRLVDEHLGRIVPACCGKLSEWDVTNETNTNNDLQRITGSEEILYNTFKKTNKFDPDVELFTNEYGIISNGGLDEIKQDWYFNYVKRVDENTGGLVDGIGIQCHIGSNVTTPTKILSVLHKFSKLNKRIVITEFTHETLDEEFQAKYLRDFYTAAFSHPSVSAIVMWGYWEGKMRKPLTAIYRQNWEIKPNGEEFVKLTKEHWHSDITVNTDETGTIKDRVFLGDYSITVTKGDIIKNTEVSVNSNSDLKLIAIVLD